MNTITSLAKMFRFVIAGGVSTIFYVIFAFILSINLTTEFLYIHILAFCLAIPFSYFLQKDFTFQLKGQHRAASWRFLTTTLVAFTITTLISFLLVDIWLVAQWGYILMVAVTVPVISFISMRYWVFVDRNTPNS
jgi:putative flippase GtrA